MAMFTSTHVLVSQQIALTNHGQKSKTQESCLQLLVKFSSTISCQKDYHTLQEPTNANLTEGVPAKYFLPLGGNIKEAIEGLEINPPFKKKNLGNIIAEIFKRFRTTETSALLDRMKNPATITQLLQV